MGLSALKWEVTSKDSKVKLNRAARCSCGWIINLISSIYLRSTCSVKRILPVHVSRSAFQTRFTKQFFSTSRFTDTKNGRSRLHETKLASPLSMASDLPSLWNRGFGQLGNGQLLSLSDKEKVKLTMKELFNWLVQGRNCMDSERF